MTTARAAFCLLPCAFISCAHVRPDEMGAQAHRQEARDHQAEGERQRGRYDPDARAVAPIELFGIQEGSAMPSPRTYNPTERYLHRAESHERNAREHLQAAEALERSESSACQDIPSPERRACPLVRASVSWIEETSVGVSLHFRDEPSAASTAKRMRCHLAFAREAGFAQVAQCPLYFAGVTMEQKTPLSLDIMGENHGIAVEIQRQTREAFAPVKSAAERP